LLDLFLFPAGVVGPLGKSGGELLKHLCGIDALCTERHIESSQLRNITACFNDRVQDQVQFGKLVRVIAIAL